MTAEAGGNVAGAASSHMRGRDAPATRPTLIVGPSKFDGIKRLFVRIVPRPTALLVPASASGTARSVTVISRLSRDSKSPSDQMAVREGRSYCIGAGVALTSSKSGLKTKSARVWSAVALP